MHRAVLFFALVAISSVASWNDVSSRSTFPVRQGQSFVQQPIFADSVLLQDETDLVDTRGAGYSFFKKQPIVSRPIAQQKLAISEQQVPISSFDDTPNQWSDYTKSSAFKHVLLPTQARTSVPIGFSNQDLQQQPNHFITPLQSIKVLTGPLALSLDDTLVPGGYGQQVQQRVVRPIIRTLNTDYDQSQQVAAPYSTDVDVGPQYQQAQPVLQRLLRPTIKLVDTGYDQPSSYGQQLPPQQRDILDTIIVDVDQQYQQYQQPQPVLQRLVRPTIKLVSTGYDQPSSYGQQLPQPQPDVYDPTIVDVDQQYQQPQPVLQRLVRPTIKLVSTGYDQPSSYGQQLPPQQRDVLDPVIVDVDQQYQQYQQPQPVLQRLVRPTIKLVSTGYDQPSSYGQQLPPQQRDFFDPTIVDVDQQYQQAQPVQQRFVRPLVKSVNVDFGQQFPQGQQIPLNQQFSQSQQFPQSQQVLQRPPPPPPPQNQQALPRPPPPQGQQQFPRPMMNTGNGGFNQQQQPDSSSFQGGQLSMRDQQPPFLRGNPGMMPFSRSGPQMQQPLLMSDSALVNV